jgi:hypothetical protein
MKPTRSLRLARQTLRTLTGPDLAAVAGGGPQPIASNNPAFRCQLPHTTRTTRPPPTDPMTWPTEPIPLPE